ncbi:UNVERIFIED_CONTAM: hypothetical protein PYX00_004543 [Menopon gallinae]|uniref:Sodium/calcium exchanger membrane region domain-containing protein n=1 Tax=Menopon gallinae TaxID=328185 RepID=A0AAW2I650_9NEOP
MFLIETHKVDKFRTRRQKSLLKYKIILFGCFFTCVFVIFNLLSRPEPEIVRNVHAGRSLLSELPEKNCSHPAIEDFPQDIFTREQRRNGAVLLHFLLTCYLFVLLAFVCDDYFIPSIQTICQRLNMSEDVAGATFMAAATSSPELFINIIGTFVTEGDIGIGTIVGSAVFNILAVPACCGLFGGQEVKIDWWPLTRDCFVYGATVVLLIFDLEDGHIDWYESLILVILYVFYIIAMYYNDTVSRNIKRLVRKRRQYKYINLQRETTPLLKNGPPDYWDVKVQVEGKTVVGSCSSTSSDSEVTMTDDENLTTIPSGFWPKCFFFVSWPIALVLFLTIPDCRKEKKQKLWPLTFIMCIVWIATTSYVVSWMITVVGDTMSIPDSVMGLTFLAAGMSVPEATSSVIVTNQGHGAMGISSSIGSNTFDILLCLGLPWLIKSTFLPTDPTQHIVQINSDGLGYTAMSLLTTLILLYISFALNRFKLDRKIGIICLVMYISFLIFASLIELNVFFTVNLPPCGS